MPAKYKEMYESLQKKKPLWDGTVMVYGFILLSLGSFIQAMLFLEIDPRTITN